MKRKGGEKLSNRIMAQQRKRNIFCSIFDEKSDIYIGER